jgi:RNA polymerase sigma-70 factor (ECF subfamily)
MRIRRHDERRQEGTASSFDQVIQAAKCGDEHSVSALYLGHIAMVFGYLRACGSPEADDVASEVFVGMLRGLSKFDGDESDFRRWLMTIAHRRLIDQRRRQGRNRTDLSDTSLLAAIQDRRSPSELRALEMDAALVDAFGRLTDAQREVLALRFVADESLQGVAAITGRPTSAVKSLQNRGLESLRRYLSVPKAQLNV